VGGQVQYTRHLLGGGMYEFTDDGTDITTRQYYNVGGIMVAMKEWVNEGSKTTSYFASDHLSSTSLVMDSSGNLLSENRYMPFGETRTISGTTSITETDFGYTGQRDYSHPSPGRRCQSAIPTGAASHPLPPERGEGTSCWVQEEG